MLVPTANVIIGFNQDIIKRLFALKGNSYETVINALPKIDTTNSTFILNNGTGSSLLSLKHQFGFSKASNILTISFVDPTNDFEKRLLSSREFPSFLMRELSDLVDVPNNFEPSIEHDLEAGVSVVIPKILEIVDIQRLNTIYKEFLESNKGYLDPYVYLAYGTGNNLKTWHGPSKWLITSIDVNITSEGSRQFNLGMSPISVGLTTAYRADAFGRPFTSLSIWEEAVDAYSPEITFTQASVKGNPLSPDNIDVLLPDNYHRLITECIRDYVRKFTRKKNVIVLLPDLNIALGKLVASIAGDNKTLSIGNEFHTRNFVEFIPPYQLSKDALSFEILRALAETLGFNLVSDRPTGEYDNIAGSKPNPIGGPSVQAFLDREVPDVYSVTADFLKSKFKFNLYASTYDKEFYLDSEVLYEVLNKIRKYCSDVYSFKPVIHYENGLDVIEVWKKYQEHPLFSGSLGELDDTEDGVVVVGDSALLRNFLYGEFDTSVLNPGSTTETLNNFDSTYGAGFPLEKLDKELLISEEYNRDISDVVLLKGGEDNGFGAISNLTDEFDVQLTDGLSLEEFKEVVNRRGIPVFRFNTQEPNVLGIRSFDSGGYFAAMKVGMAKSAAYSLHKSINALVPEELKAFGDATLGALMSNLRQTWAQQGLENVAGNKQEIINSIIADAGAMTWDNKDSTSLRKYAEMVYLLFVLQLQEDGGDNKAKIILDQFTNNNAPSTYANFVEEAYSRSRVIGISTLPFFHLSNIFSIVSQTCILYAQDLPITQTLPRPSEAINRFYSGVYRIVGFEHSITGNKVESSFNLARITAFQHSNELIKNTTSFEFVEED